jgi:ATP-dependent helicase Lhr and Lhr-like helicase
VRQAGDDAEVVVLAATDPAQPYGAGLAWPARASGDGGRPARTASSVVVLGGGAPLAWFDRSSHHLVTFPATAGDQRWAKALALRVANGLERSIEVRKVDGGAVTPEVADVLRSAGFVDGYRGLLLRAS